jgi:hypothetical protein
LSIPTAFQAVVPAAPATGVWRGTQATTAIATATQTGGIVSTPALTYGGSGYATAPTCIITSSSGSGATCSATIMSGVVTALTGGGGTGYSTPVTVSFVPQIAMGFAVTGDDATTNASTNAIVVTGVHGVSYPASPASTNTVPVVTSTSGGGATTYEQVTSAMTDSSIAPTLNPSFTGTVTMTGATAVNVPTVATTTNTTAAASTAYVQAQEFLCRQIASSDQISSAGTFATQCSVSSTGMAIASIIEVHVHGVYTTTSTSSPLFALDINAGGTTGICPASSTTTLSTSITNGYWDATCYAQIQTVGSSGTAVAWGNYIDAQANGANPSLKDFSNPSTVTYNSGAPSENVVVQETATLVSGQTFTLQSLYVHVRY